MIHYILAGRTFFPKPILLSAGADLLSPLSRREKEVMHGLLRGEPLAAIASQLGIGTKSVSTYRRRVLDKLGVQSNIELAALVARYGIS